MSDDGRPLEGLTVLDLGQIYLGPYCGMLMARMGATVIKIEPPAGEPIRFRRDPGLPIVAFDLLNAGKRGLRIDLKQPAGRDLFLRLVGQADVVIENFGPGTLERLGLGYDVLAQTNPGIVMGSGSGYGSYGPYRDFKAMDITVQAMAGVMAATGFDGAPPVKAGVAVADFGGGVHLLAAILAALLQRGRTGRGQHVEVSMHDALIPMLASNIAGFIESEGTVPQRTGNRHGGLGICPYNVYQTADGWLAILGITDRHWSSLVKLMDRPDLEGDADLRTNAGRVRRLAEVDDQIEQWSSTLTTEQALEQVRGADVPCAPVVGVAELFTDPHVRARGVLRQITGTDGAPQWVLGSPIKLGAGLDADNTDAPSPPPSLGEHSDEVLTELLALTPGELAELRQDGVI